MQQIRISSMSRKVLFPFVLTLWLSACYKWEPVDPQLASSIVSAGESDELRVMTASDTIVLVSAEVEGDALVGARGDGKAHEAYQDPESPTHLIVSVADLKSVEVERLNVLATVGLGAAAAVGTGLIMYGWIAADDWASDGCQGLLCP